jgi:hypothetical protein
MAVASSPSATLVINPAFLQEIKESNPDLDHTLRDLRQLLQSPGCPNEVCNKLARSLDDLREHLSLQFSLEEAYGYLAVSIAPSRVLSELACRTQSQHGMLYMQLSDLAEQAEELQYRGVEVDQLRRLLERTQEFDSEFRAHERAELELIERAYDLP